MSILSLHFAKEMARIESRLAAGRPPHKACEGSTMTSTPCCWAATTPATMQ
jgi:hypothetical protein